MALSKVKVFSFSRYIEAALKNAEYEPDGIGMVVDTVPGVSGFFAQGESYEDARANLQEVIEGNVLLTLHLGWEVPSVPGVDIQEKDVESRST